MTQQQAAIARTHVVRLARLGAKLRLTAEPIGKLKTLTWKSVPQFVRRPGNLFVCPSCGERFLVQRWQHQPAQAVAPAAAAAPAPAAAPAEPEPVEAEPVAAEPVEAEPVDEEPMAEEPRLAEEPEAVEEAEPAVPATEPLDAEEPLEAEAEEVVAEAEPLMAEPIEAEPLEAEPIEEPEPEPEPYEEPEPDLEPAVAPEAATTGPVYDVSVAKVRGPKQDRLAELIAERLRISFEEASRMCERTIIMVCKGAPESEAASWRKALANLGLKPRIRKRT
jgi:hypothetical protein